AEPAASSSACTRGHPRTSGLAGAIQAGPADHWEHPTFGRSARSTRHDRADGTRPGARSGPPLADRSHGGGAQPGDDCVREGEPAGGRRGLSPDTEIDPLHRAEWYYRDAVRVRAEAHIAVRPQASGYLSSEGLQIRINAGEPAVQRPQRISIKTDRRLRD